MAPEFMRDIRRTILWDPLILLSDLPLGGCHPLWRVVPDNFELISEGVKGPVTPHLRTFLPGFGLPYAVFDRLY
jgi:hypothetical protein